MLNRPFIDGVRVIKESKKSIAQLEPMDILFEKVKQKTEGKVFVQQILDAPLCSTTEDLYEWPARSTINQLMRTYLDKVNITATELMHSAKEIKRLLDEGTLINSATAKVAALPECRIFEVGISYYGRTYAEGKKIGWRDGFRAIYAIIRYNLFP